ncbi:hypothetical protein AMJ51_00080 [Microgenomates bacterium DG_75]|nr:MAG: hypothetical protein AMJ51_00080 [Microgenomates bacterium DG_75]
MEILEPKKTKEDWARFNREAHKKRLQEGVHPLISALRKVGDDYIHGVIDDRLHMLRRAKLNRKIRALGGLEDLISSSSK